MDHDASVQGHQYEQAHANGEGGVDVLARCAVLYRLAEQNDQGRQAVEPETRWLSGFGQTVEFSGRQQTEQQHPQKKHPQIHEQAQRAPEKLSLIHI